MKGKLNDHSDYFTISCLEWLFWVKDIVKERASKDKQESLLICSYVVTVLNLAVFREFNPSMFKSSAE